MSLSFDHIHLISADPAAAAAWYEEMLGGKIVAEYELRAAPQINVAVGGMQLIIRGRRPGEAPATTRRMQDFGDYASHNEWGTDHFGYTYRGDLRAFCEALLDPLEETFGRVAVRSGYRSAESNAFGNKLKLNCARNGNPIECPIWDWSL